MGNYSKEYYRLNKRKFKIAQKKYQNSEKGRINKIKSNRKHRNTIKGYLAVVYNNIKERCAGESRSLKNINYIRNKVKNKFKSLNEFRNYIMNDLDYNNYKKIKGLQIDRINNDGHYEKDNIRFVTPKENCINRN